MYYSESNMALWKDLFNSHSFEVFVNTYIHILSYITFVLISPFLTITVQVCNRWSYSVPLELSSHLPQTKSVHNKSPSWSDRRFKTWWQLIKAFVSFSTYNKSIWISLFPNNSITCKTSFRRKCLISDIHS